MKISTDYEDLIQSLVDAIELITSVDQDGSRTADLTKYVEPALSEARKYLADNAKVSCPGCGEVHYVKSFGAVRPVACPNCEAWIPDVGV